VILALDQAPRDLFAEYRSDGGTEYAVGNGLVTLVPSATSQEMRQALREPIQRAGTSPILVLTDDVFSLTISTAWLMDWLGTRFRFPSLSWMLIWTAVYIVVVGALNFYVLRRIGKVELGWVTVPALALLFGTVFYFLSAHGRLKRFAIDEMTICWMDDKSPMVASESRIRVASPQVRDVSLAVPRDAVLNEVAFDPLFRAGDVADVWDEHTDRRPSAPNIRVDEAQHLTMEMLRLSFRDFAFRSIRQFPGTVHIEKGRLKNSTGQSFSQAVLVDPRADKFYDLGALPDQAEIQPFAREAQKLSRKREQMSITEVMHSWDFPRYVPTGTLFFVGLSSQSMLGGQLEGIGSDRRNFNFVFVRMRQEHD
jgi:hypothetical protein